MTEQPDLTQHLAPWDDYPTRIDPDAADRSPLDHISEGRLRAEDAYEPGAPEGPSGHTLDPETAALLHRCAREADRLLRESQPIREHASQADAALRGLSSWRRP